MGNCCGGTLDMTEASPSSKPRKLGGGPPVPHVMTPNDLERRELARKAAEDRARQNAVRGTQRTTPKQKPKYLDAPKIDKGGPDISDWN